LAEAVQASTNGDSLIDVAGRLKYRYSLVRLLGIGFSLA